MKILLVSNCSLNPNQGSGYVICGFAERMRERGHVVEAYGPEDFIWLPKMRRLKRLRLLLGYTWTALRRTFGGSFNVVELWGGPGWLSILLLSLIPKRSFLLVSRSNGLEPHYSHVMRRKCLFESQDQMRTAKSTLEEIGYRRCDALTLVGKFDEDYATARSYLPFKQILAIENPLEEEWLRQEVDLDRGQVVGFVGTWIVRKGADIFPDAMRLVIKTAPKVRFIIIGVGEESAALLRAEFPDPRKVEIIPGCSRTELRMHYHRMSILIAPSIYESFGLIFAEAMSCGVALIATPVGFAAGLESGVEFSAIESRTSLEVARLITNFLDDDSYRRQIADAGYQRIQSLQWDEATRQIESLYANLHCRPA